MDLNLKSAERQINNLIEKRAREAEQANREEQAARLALDAYHGRRAGELRRAWVEHHRHMAETFERLTEEHREQLLRLIDGGA